MKSGQYDYTKDAQVVIAAERAHIEAGRDEPIAQRGLWGLALSGGGIRSASFCLGVVQALVAARVLRKFDYLSTASGGGYLGGGLTWFLRRGLPGGGPAGTEPENFPYGRIGAAWAAGPRNPNAILDYLRQHGRYLTPSHLIDGASFVAVLLRTVLIALLVYFALATAVTIFLAELGAFSAFEIAVPGALFGMQTDEVWRLSLPNFWAAAALVLAAFFLLGTVGYGLIVRLQPARGASRYLHRLFNQAAMGGLLKLIAATALLASLPWVEDRLERWALESAAAGAGTGLGTLLGLVASARGKLKGGGKGQGVLNVAAAVLILYGLALGAWIVAEWVIASPLSTRQVAWALALGAIVVGWLVNLNEVGLHRMYRDRLMEAFMPEPDAAEAGRWAPAIGADKTRLCDVCAPPNNRPYHLINCNLVLADSPTARFRNRGGDNFLLSPLYCGASATGWRRTDGYMTKSGRGMTLASAVAISGAALNPNAANSGQGVGRNRWVSILNTLLNLRLGYWAWNPARAERRFWNANFISPALSQSVLARGLKESAHLVELSDGGHFDNLAVYELIRRRLPVIVVCDGGADPDFTFADLSNLTERVRVDFGARIEFDEDCDLGGVLPGTCPDPTLAERYGAAARGFAVARIRYLDGSEGRLVYVKATMIAGLPVDVYGYKAANPRFPHQPTADQFFDEAQIEAYRELGYHIGWRMLEANAGVEPGQPLPEGPGRWF